MFALKAHITNFQPISAKSAQWSTVGRMPNARYIPRMLCLDTLDFGSKKNLRWKDEDHLRIEEVDYLGAAKLQHQFAMVVNERVDDRFTSLRDYASFAGVKYERWGRLLRGDIVMRLEDIALAQRIFGPLMVIDDVRSDLRFLP